MKRKDKRPDIKRRIIWLAGVFVLMAAVAVVQTGRLFGWHVRGEAGAAPYSQDGVIETTGTAGDIVGFRGPVPVAVHFSGGRIDSVTVLANSESPSFMRRVERSGLLRSWNGLTPQEGAALEVDAVSGATYTSRAVIANVRLALDQAMESPGLTGEVPLAPDTPGSKGMHIAAAVVLLCAAIVPFFTRRKFYRIVQQLLNTAVLGFWAGAFMSYSLLIRFFSDGAGTGFAAAVVVILMAVAFGYPLFTGRNHYCAWVCPYGSLQELAGHLSPWKIRISPALAKVLMLFRRVLWAVLVAFLFVAALWTWTDYEIFTAFIFRSAAMAVLVAAAVFVVLSLFVPRPFCRFLCPMGTMLSGK